MGSTAGKRDSAFAALALMIILCVAGPLFLRMPLWADVTLYDLAARNVIRGGIHYRDVFDTNPPGIVWIHLLVRSVFGWSVEAIRAFDLMVVLATATLLACGLRTTGGSWAASLWLGFTLLAFYLATSEGSHCQRDVWMLLPAVGAAALCRRRLERWDNGRLSLPRVFLFGAAEGLLWGAACWIKPFVLVPAGCLWLVACARRRGGPPGSDFLGLAAGMLVAFGLGFAWLVASNTLLPFLDVLCNWLPEYGRHARGLGARLGFALCVYRPWCLVHLLAVPLAVLAITRVRAMTPWSPLLAALYLGWLMQATFLQKDHEYVIVPTIVLGIAVVAEKLQQTRTGGWLHLAGGAVVAGCLATTHPLLQIDRLAAWPQCCTQAGTPTLRNRLRLSGAPLATDWEALARVADFLRSQNLADGELMCYHNFTHPLLLDLDLAPCVRFLHCDTILACFPKRHVEFRSEVAGSRQRLVVSDLGSLGLKPTGCEPALPSEFPPSWRSAYPWSETIVFRAGQYVVHRVDRPVTHLFPQRSSLARAPRKG